MRRTRQLDSDASPEIPLKAAPAHHHIPYNPQPVIETPHMMITEFAIIRFYAPPDLSKPTPHTVLQLLSDWQSACSGLPLYFFTDEGDPCLVHLVTGWTSVEAHEAWICGERNQALRKVFAPYVDVEGVRMVHLDVEFGRVPSDGGLVAERFHSGQEGVEGDLVGRDLGQSGDVYRFIEGTGGQGYCEVVPIERWVLTRVNL